MAVHVIILPDGMRSDELRTIIWDEAAGTVAGTHFRVPDCCPSFDTPQGWFASGIRARTWDLHDPVYKPPEFPTSLGELYWPVLEELLRSTLPLIFDRVETLPGDPGEILHDMHRDILE